MNPSQTIRWGILGTARIATKVAGAINATDGAEVAAVASRSAERAAGWAEEHGIGRSYGDYQALLDDDELDAIYIPLPPSMHAQWTIRAAEAGKHVICEKPIAISATQAAEMAAACREHNVQLMDATMWVHHPRSADMLRAVKDGALGEMRRVTAAFGFVIEPYLEQKPPHMARDPETGQADAATILTHELRFQRELGGGSLLDTGWYCVRVALWAFGDLPREVFAKARYRYDVDVSLSGLMWYDDDRVASFDCGYDVATRKWFEVAGTRGTLVCDDFLTPWDPERPRFWLHEQPGEANESVSAPEIQEQCMIHNFCQIIRSGSLDEHWPNISIANQRICDALDKSARSGQVVTLDNAT
jgi:predicted dehydrogenase